MILHVCARETIKNLRDSVLRMHGYQVISTVSLDDARGLISQKPVDLILIDVEGDSRIPHAEEFCQSIKKENPRQKVAFVCNYRVSKESHCPDEVIHADFNPAGLVKGVRAVLG